MKPIVPILGIASLLWLTLGTWWMSNTICSPKNNASFTINDGKFKTSSPEMFTFLLSNYNMQYTESTGKSLQALSNHMEKNPNKQLTLTGLYGENEKNDSSYDNLGIARSENIKDYLIKHGANGDNIRTTSLQSDNLDFYTTEDKNGKTVRQMRGGVNFSLDGETGGSFDSSDDSINSGDNSMQGGEISFAPGSTMFLDITDSNSSFTKTESFKNYFAELKAYLGDHPDQKLIVTSYNDDSGLATTITRKVKSVFRKLGLETTSITRRTGKESDSPSGLAGVNVEITSE